LWGVADMTGSTLNAEPSVLFSIDPGTGAASGLATTLTGVESLAIGMPVCTAPEGEPLPPAIPTLDRAGLGLLGALLALIALTALRPGRH